jgi:thioredoxin 1
MNRRSLITLVAIALIVAGLGLYRSSRRSPAGEADPVAEPGHGLPGILDFGRGECSACKRMMPVLEGLAEKHAGRIVIRYVDMNFPEGQKRADDLGIRLIPTQILIDAEGNEVVRHEGFWSAEDIELELEVLEWIPPQ